MTKKVNIIPEEVKILNQNLNYYNIFSFRLSKNVLLLYFTVGNSNNTNTNFTYVSTTLNPNALMKHDRMISVA